MSEKRTCPDCGAELPSDGACVPCHLRLVVSERETPEGNSQKSTIYISPPLTEKPGDRIGRYKLLKQIGEGGMGTVWEAEQMEPVRRRVALKVIKLGMDTKEVIARFEAERQALALMSHASIAKAFDAGATDTGRPFFVMELVSGDPITEFCDKHKLSTSERLDLFIQACQAVQHAHQKGIIHRDIKPSNILVTYGDGGAVPKIIDFGIAKATAGQRLTDKTLVTQFEQFIGTPAYISPEQAEMTGVDIDTRSDIYSLGVLLYELLTGKRPFEDGQLLKAGLDEMRRIIREVDPPRPSTRLITLDASDQTAVAMHRRSEVPKLLGQICGDLDWIAMKAMDKDRTRRYETANGLAMDVRRFLIGESVIARPPTKLYRFQKLIRRNKLTFAAGGAVAAATVLGLGVITWLLFKSEAASRDANVAHRNELRLRQQAELAQTKAEENARQALAEALKSRRNEYAADMSAAQQAITEGNLGHARTILRGHLPHPGQEDLRGFEWHYFQNLSLGSQLKTLHGKGNGVNLVSWSPDGRTIASGSRDGTVRLWDVETAETAGILSAHKGIMTCAVFSPDGRLLATGGEDRRLHLWDVASRSVLLSITNRSFPRVAFSPDASLLAVATGGAEWGADGGTVELRNCVSGSLVRPLEGSGNRVAFSPDGTLLATANGVSTVKDVRELMVREINTGRKTKSSLVSGYVLSLTFSPDGRTLAFATGEGEIGLWDMEADRPSVLRPRDRDWVTCVSFSPDGQILAASLVSHRVELWDLAKRTLIRTLFGHAGAVWSVAFSPDGKRLVSASDDGEVMLWNPNRRNNDELKLSLPLNRYFWLGNPLLSPDGQTLAAADERNNVQLIDTASLRTKLVLTNAGFPVAFAPPSSNILTRDGSFDGTFKSLQLWEPSTGRLVSSTPMQLKNHKWYAGAISHDQSCLVVASLKDRTVNVVDTHTGKLLAELTSQIGPWTVALSPDNGLLAVGGIVSSEGVAELWDVRSKRRVAALEGHKKGISVVAFSPDGNLLVTGSWDSTLKVWDIPNRKEITTLTSHKSELLCCTFSPDGRTLASSGGADRSIKLWNIATFRELASFQLSGPASLVEFSSDGSTLLSGSERTLHLLRTQPTTPPEELTHSEQGTTTRTLPLPKQAQERTVRVVYMVSQDRQVQTNYQHSVENAIRDLQGWYSRQLNGPTFKLHNPVVEVVHSSQPADWFYGHSNGANRDDWGYNNTLAEASRLLGARLNDPHFVWVLYSDGPGNKGRGGSGVTCLPEDDLLGLIGQHPAQKDPKRWIGGLGHELGHAFGLPHPADTVRDADAIMWAGFYGKYPDQCYLTESDKSILLQSPFFFDYSGEPVFSDSAFLEKFVYDGGYFAKFLTNNPGRWKEVKTDSAAAFYFQELKRDDSIITLKDSTRGMTIELPINGGDSKFSWDGGKTWQQLYKVRKE